MAGRQYHMLADIRIGTEPPQNKPLKRLVKPFADNLRAGLHKRPEDND